MKSFFGIKTSTKVTTPVKSSLSFHEAEQLWIQHPEKVWVIADILSVDEGAGTAVVKSESGETTIELKDSHIYHHTHTADLDNLCFMNNFHEAPLLDALRERSRRQKIYTDIGNVLVSVNPYENIEGLYDRPLDYFSYDRVDSTDFTVLPPHVYYIANTALTSMLKSTSLSCLSKYMNQSLVISGESGAGKTEASKKVVSFLIDCDMAMIAASPAEVEAGKNRRSSKLHSGLADLKDVVLEGTEESNGHLATSTSDSTAPVTVEGAGEVISKRILDSTFIFESFGNAKTIRNDNSSRFGKFIKLQYGSSNRVCGAHVDTFLLELSRLCHVAPGERNYHIFYQMLRGEHKSLDKYLLEIGAPEDFHILCSKGTDVTKAGLPAYPDKATDASEFTHLCDALETLGCTEDQLVNVWRVLAAILHMGNCYTASTSVDGPADNMPLNVHCSSVGMEFIARTFGIEVHELHQALTIRIIRAYKRASFSAKMLLAEEVMHNIYAVIKFLYSALFRWLQSMVNAAFKADDDVAVESFIGILDIFGFEIMETNSFEQLCINYANELLQKLFNETIFTTEQEAYAAEGIVWQQLDYQDNQAIIDLLSLKPNGLFPTIEAQGMLNRKSGGDAALVAAFSKAHLKSSNGIYSESRFGNGEAFVIRHFAGSVEYAVDGFLDKNNCSLQEDLMEVLRGSNKPFIREIFQLDDEEGDEADNQGGGLMAKVKTRIKRMSSGGQHKKPSRLATTNTVSDQFMEQLNILLDSLRETRTHYVKCIKPNTTKSPGVFDAPLVMQQLRCNGIMELVRIKRQGYPTHSEFIDFYKVFQLLGHGRKWVHPGECTIEQAKEYTSAIAAYALPSNMYQVGHNMIFLRDGFEVLMRDSKIRMLNMLSTRIQTMYRRFRDHRAYLACRRKVILVQCLQRARVCARKYAKVIANVVTVQKVIRCLLCQMQFKKCRKAAVIIQTQARRLSAQRKLAYMKYSAVLVSSVLRMHLHRSSFARKRAAAVTLQCAIRCRAARKRRRVQQSILMTQRARQRKVREMAELRASILILAFFKSIKRCGGREKARGKVAPPVSIKGVVVKSLCARFINILRQKTPAGQKLKNALK